MGQLIVRFAAQQRIRTAAALALSFLKLSPCLSAGRGGDGGAPHHACNTTPCPSVVSESSLLLLEPVRVLALPCAIESLGLALLQRADCDPAG
jgi:hypothetical protein